MLNFLFVLVSLVIALLPLLLIGDRPLWNRWKKYLTAAKRARAIWMRCNKEAWHDFCFERGSSWFIVGFWGKARSVEMHGWYSASSSWGDKTRWHMRRLLRLHARLSKLGHKPQTDWY
jgi:hypothetical protein